MELSQRGLGLHDATEDDLSVTRRIRPSSHKPRRVLGVGGCAARGWLPGGVADCYRFMLAEISSEARRLSKRACFSHRAPSKGEFYDDRNQRQAGPADIFRDGRAAAV
jgi:hypothetical protein